MDSIKNNIQELFTDDSELLTSELDNVKVAELFTDELTKTINYPVIRKTTSKIMKHLKPDKYGNINCFNCEGCVNCINCVDCKDCDGCIACKDCFDCK